MVCVQVCALMDHVTEDLHDAVAEGQDTDCDHLIRMLQVRTGRHSGRKTC